MANHTPPRASSPIALIVTWVSLPVGEGGGFLVMEAQDGSIAAADPDDMLRVLKSEAMCVFVPLPVRVSVPGLRRCI